MMTLEQFRRDCQKKQLSHIASERRRLKKARRALARYLVAMADLGLHPMTSREILDRAAELDQMHLDAKSYPVTPALRCAHDRYVRHIENS